MNCAERLVSIFGSQAEVARRFRLDRAVVNNWVKSGYVPARWAMEVEHVTDGQVTAVEILNEANARKPVRVKSRPDGENLFGSSLTGSDAMNEFAPKKRISSFHPPQRTLMGPGPTEIHPRVLTTMSQPAIGYLDPVFVEMMEELKGLLRYTYQTKNALTFPVSGPISGTRWVLQTVLDEAERKYYDEAAIHHEMAELEKQHQAGVIDDDSFEAQEEQLLERLMEARKYHQRKREQGG